MGRITDAEARAILDTNQVIIMEDTASPSAIVERLALMGKLELPAELGGVAAGAAMKHGTIEDLTSQEISDLTAQGAITYGWGGIAIPINRTESQL